ncbi:hypothetical protein ACFQ3A_09755, partial [Sphaerisporangium aureirubrum]
MPEPAPAPSSGSAPRPSPGAGPAPARPRPERGGPSATLVAVLLDTAPGGAAADRLAGELVTLAVRELHVVTRVAG